MPAAQLMHDEAPAAEYVPAQGKPGQQRQGGKAEPERQARRSARGRGQARALSSLVSGERLAGETQISIEADMM